MGDRQDAARTPLEEERNHAAAAADDVAVAHAAEARDAAAAVGVGRDEQLVGAQLARAVQIDRVGRLVGAERDDLRHARVERGVDDVLRANHVRLDELERVVFGRGHLLERRRVNDDVDALERAPEAVAIAHVAEKETQARIVREPPRHLALLHLVAAEHDEPLRVRVLQRDRHELLAERSGATGDEHGLAGERARGDAGGLQ